MVLYLSSHQGKKVTLAEVSVGWSFLSLSNSGELLSDCLACVTGRFFFQSRPCPLASWVWFVSTPRLLARVCMMWTTHSVWKQFDLYLFMLILELIGSAVSSANVSNGFAWETCDDDCCVFRGKWTNPTGSGSMNLYCWSDPIYGTRLRQTKLTTQAPDCVREHELASE